MRVIIVGAGIGGLACAIACRQKNLDVLVLEQSAEIVPVGAGIQIPPNGARIMQELGLLSQTEEKGMKLEVMDLRRYKDGRIITSMSCGESIVKEYGAPWIVIHRADYHQILLDKARDLGVEIHLGALVEKVLVDETAVIVGSETITGDVIIGADGLWSKIREAVLDEPHPPEETGDLAYRATFSRAQLLALNDPEVKALCEKQGVTAWLGPKKHAVFYPVRGGQEYNLVLLQPDDLPPGVRTTQGDVDEMRYGYREWDPTLGKMISCIPTVLKWKLCHLPELPRWTKGSVTLLGDACHPTLPYQAQGAAMAVEDGAVLGLLLHHVASSQDYKSKIPQALTLYEDIRKSRTARNVQGAIRNRGGFHLEDGILQRLRDLVLSWSGLTWETDWIGLMSSRQRAVLGFDVLQEVEQRMSELSA
ncbi:putative salicylate hydroxylase [Aspergillus fischeri NRRL 181]|uniref:Salicylate hydroxylase, putative n=1 Tax=Neosartorya fischeri (strain ATCC 1020 / DSM 3700 / CBS 544.65 / FGSC A1164 / JCM 1740 / NRRL 181 / WB 181) TaxID=331117 RepID=A1DEG9_NEOFI|nr:salicylate hydroxylase, putative [Aspergillus fischeri NRRL 181]EAW17776.1 salicylate hydroxylase, putative [Aspergillus fischeri NRRL 181]